MPNKDTHAVDGAVAGLLAYCFAKLSNGEQGTLWGALVAAGFATAVGQAPDILEPATHPNHRGVCHSIASLFGVSLVVMKVIESSSLTPQAKTAILVASAAYAGHLLADASTSKGLPLLA